MRTVTFANLEVVAYLKEHFVLVWHDQTGSQASVVAQPSAAAGDYPEGGGGSNLSTFWCTPDGKVFRYLEGYWGVERYLAEARQALQFFHKLADLPETHKNAAVLAALNDRRL